MKFLSVAGTVAMFMVGGGIVVHGIAPLHHAVEHAAEALPLSALVSALLNTVLGILAGALVLAAVTLGKKLLPKRS